MHKRLFLYGLLMMASPVMAQVGKADAAPPAARQATWAKVRALLSTERGQWMALTTLSWLLSLGKWAEVPVEVPAEAESVTEAPQSKQCCVPLITGYFYCLFGKKKKFLVYCWLAGLCLLFCHFYEKSSAQALAVPGQIDSAKPVGWIKWLIVHGNALFDGVISLCFIEGGWWLFYSFVLSTPWKMASMSPSIAVTEGWLLMQLGRGLCFLVMESLALATEPAARQETWAKARAFLSSERGQWVVWTTCLYLLCLISGTAQQQIIEGKNSSVVRSGRPLTMRFCSLLIGAQAAEYFGEGVSLFGLVLLWQAFYKKIAAWLLVVPDEVDADKKVGWGKWLCLVIGSWLVASCCLYIFIGGGSRMFYAWRFSKKRFEPQEAVTVFSMAIVEGWLLMQLGRCLYSAYHKVGHTMDGTGQGGR